MVISVPFPQKDTFYFHNSYFKASMNDIFSVKKNHVGLKKFSFPKFYVI